MSRAWLLNVTGGAQIEQSETAVLGPHGLRALGRAILPAAGRTRDLPSRRHLLYLLGIFQIGPGQRARRAGTLRRGGALGLSHPR